RLNAFTARMMHELLDAFERADADDAVRAIIVTGAGRAFCAGADLGSGGATFDHSSGPQAQPIEEHRDGGGLVTLRIFASKKPVIAAIDGAAVGVGITMTLPTDVRIAASGARIGFVFARRGIVGGACRRSSRSGRRASRSGRARTCPSSTPGGKSGSSGERLPHRAVRDARLQELGSLGAVAQALVEGDHRRLGVQQELARVADARLV